MNYDRDKIKWPVAKALAVGGLGILFMSALLYKDDKQDKSAYDADVKQGCAALLGQYGNQKPPAGTNVPLESNKNYDLIRVVPFSGKDDPNKIMFHLVPRRSGERVKEGQCKFIGEPHP